MAGKVTTGHNARWGDAITSRAHELLRRGTYAHAEQTNDPVASGLPRTLKIDRRTETAPGSSSARIAPTWATVAGLDAIPGTVWLPAPWNDRDTETGITLRASERMVSLVDIPATVAERGDVLLLTDRVVFDDPVYGTDAVFNVVRVPFSLAGIVHAQVVYAHADEAV